MNASSCDEGAIVAGSAQNNHVCLISLACRLRVGEAFLPMEHPVPESHTQPCRAHTGPNACSSWVDPTSACTIEVSWRHNLAPGASLARDAFDRLNALTKHRTNAAIGATMALR